MSIWSICPDDRALGNETVGNDQDLFKLGTVHYQRGQWDYAIKRFEEILKSSEDSNLKSLSRFYLAESLVAKKEFNAAQKHLQLFLESNPEHQLTPQARFRLGEVSYMNGDRDVALEELSSFAKSYADHELMEFALPYLGELRLNRGQLDLAVEVFQQSLKDFPAGALANESRFGLARALEKTESVEAERFYAYLISRPESGRSADSLLQLAKVRFRQNKWDEAENLLNRFASEYPNHALLVPVCYWQGRVSFAKEEWTRANSFYFKGLKRHPKPEVVPALRYELARSLTKQDRLVDAITQLQIVSTEFPDSDWADDSQLLRIQILRNNQQNRLAIDLCNQFYRSFPNSDLRFHVMESEAECHFGEENYTVAEKLYSYLLGRSQSNNEEPDAKLNLDVESWKYKLAVCLIKQKKTSQALATLEKIDQENASREIQLASLLALASIQIDRNQHAAATKNLIQYVEQNPSGAESEKCIVDIALLLAKRGNFPSASQWVSRLKRSGSAAATLLQMGDIAFAAQQFVFASNWYSRALQSATDRRIKCQAMMGNMWSAKELGNIESTVLLAQRLVDAFPNSDQAPEALYLMAVLQEKSGDHKKALASFEKMLKRYPQSRYQNEVLLSLVGLYRSTSPEELEQLVIPISQVVSTTESDKHEALTYELAWILKDIGKPEKARQCFERLVQQFPNGQYHHEALYQIADFEVQNENTEEAIRQLSFLAKKNLDQKIGPLVHHQLGQLYFKDSDFDSAYSHWNEIATNYTTSELVPVARYWSAESMFRRKNWSLAFQGFSRICKLNDKGDEFLERSCLRLAQTSIKLEKWNSTIDAGRQLIDLTDEGMLKAKAEFVIGRANSSLGLFSKARTAYQSVLNNSQAKGTETAAMAQWMIGETWFHQEQFEKAIDAYQRTEILHAWPQWQAAALLQAAKCFERQSKFQLARENCQRILTSHPDSQFVSAAKELLASLDKNSTSISSDKNN